VWAKLNPNPRANGDFLLELQKYLCNRERERRAVDPGIEKEGASVSKIFLKLILY
jgi:hypothetical protein